jgi:AmmeMemoRadiSam system protein B
MLLTRSPAVAGQFYPDSSESCRAQVASLLAAAPELPADFVALAGIAPHAGWVCSGAVAAQVVRALAARGGVETFVIFGAVHRPMRSAAAVYDRGAWETPLGEALIDEPLAAAVVRSGPLVAANPRAHDEEHSIEVEVPFIQHLAPSARLLPIMVSPSSAAAEVGQVVARAAAELGRRVAFLGSTDLTHYGPRYRFAPQGLGPDGIRWAKEVNDRRMLDLVTGLAAGQIVHEAAEHHNACGPGAIAATIAAAQAAGATTGRVLNHTNSNEVLCSRYGQMEDAVGYAGVVFGLNAGAGS